MSSPWSHLVRFVAQEDGQVHLGQVDAGKWQDVGLATLEGERIPVNLVKGNVFDGCVTEEVMHVQELLSPLTMEEVPIIRCMGLNYRDHALEANIAIPEVPVLFVKPRTALAGPHPAPIKIPRFFQDSTSDYEAELSVVLSKSGRDIPESDAMDYVLGYTCSNDVSARKQQFMNSQWCFSKGLDGSCPVGPILVARSALKDPCSLRIRAIHNGQTVQDSNTRYFFLPLYNVEYATNHDIIPQREMIFDIPKIIAFLSQGTTLEKGTIIMTGTGPGIGMARDPPIFLKDGDDMRIQISETGTLVNFVKYE
ncbi:fumarylacetoacetate hydrolase domain-containing protein 2A [Colletotrichum kahawae]|uniref:Fumarylacetoacetate hydrolase domain-containing protein 2A n=1 Tax=Colletotrichum kahawae TaxID=34407 RepID=A0AAD9YHH0_COLKA|nr:fumarylacetoacetate hydrolase domain-containing protein 2A [Colletotrichum kahawae]